MTSAQLHILLSAREVVVGEGGTNVALFSCPELTLTRGRIVALHGPSGTGKSSLLRVLTGRQPALDGQIILPDYGNSALSVKQLRAARGTMFAQALQEEGLVEALTARENIRVGCAIAGRRADDGEIDAMATRLGLEGLLQQRPSELSGGQCQRVQLVRAFVCGAPILLLDEPTTGLDATWRRSVVELIQEEVTQRDKAAFVISHDADVIEACETVYAVTEDREVIREK